jgi:hypothetical protein
MRSPNTTKKLHTVLKATLWGVAIFVGISLVDVIGDRFLWHGNNLLIGMILLFPTILLSNLTGIEHTELSGFAHTLTFALIANGLFGAFAFFVLACFWQFVVKDESKK